MLDRGIGYGWGRAWMATLGVDAWKRGRFGNLAVGVGQVAPWPQTSLNKYVTKQKVLAIIVKVGGVM